MPMQLKFELPEDYLLVPTEQLSTDALDGLITAYVTREGTDYGELELSFETKARQLRDRLRTGEVVIIYHLTSESFDLFRSADLPRALLELPGEGPIR